MKLDNIKSRTTWSDAAASLNRNSAKISAELNRLKDATYLNKGYFSTEEELNEAYPASAVGSKAYVGARYPYAIYLWNGSGWENSGETGGEESVNLGDYYTKEETREVVEEYHVILSQSEYDALEVKEDKLYFTFED